MSIVAVKITFRQNAVVHLFLGKLRLPAAVCLALEGIPCKQEAALSLHCHHKAII